MQMAAATPGGAASIPVAVTMRGGTTSRAMITAAAGQGVAATDETRLYRVRKQRKFGCCGGGVQSGRARIFRRWNSVG